MPYLIKQGKITVVDTSVEKSSISEKQAFLVPLLVAIILRVPFTYIVASCVMPKETTVGKSNNRRKKVRNFPYLLWRVQLSIAIVTINFLNQK